MIGESMKSVIALSLVVGAMACGFGSDETASSNVSIVLEADFLDVYGAIEVGFGGNQLEVRREGQFSCENPAMEVQPGKYALEAVSEFWFGWRSEVEVPEGQSCHLVRLSVENMYSGVQAFSLGTLRDECTPVKVMVVRDYEGEEVEVGRILNPWPDFNPDLYVEEPGFSPQVKYLLEGARNSRAVVFGGGNEDESIASYRFEFPEELCGGSYGDLLFVPGSIGWKYRK